MADSLAVPVALLPPVYIAEPVPDHLTSVVDRGDRAIRALGAAQAAQIGDGAVQSG